MDLWWTGSGLRAAAEGHDPVMAARAEDLQPRVEVLLVGVRVHVREHRAAQPRGLHQVERAARDRQFGEGAEGPGLRALEPEVGVLVLDGVVAVGAGGEHLLHAVLLHGLDVLLRLHLEEVLVAGALCNDSKVVFEDGRWTDEETLFTVDGALHTSSGVHFGSRFVFDDGFVFFGIGDRGRQDQAQDLGRPNGKVFRIHDDGRVPADNPFVDVDGALPAIWSYGHRNPQGMDLEPATGLLWESEHGPRGGDDINVVGKGLNYGWPVITHGMNYNGTPITDETHREGMEQPKLHWTPSIAVAGIDFYEGDAFPAWTGKLLAGGLASEALHLLTVADGAVTADEIVLKDQGRIRDVASGPDGLIYLLLNGGDPRRGRIVRMTPAP